MELALAKPGKGTGNEKISISDEAFGRDFNEPLVHQTVVTFLAGSRQGSVKQKNRSEVRGGGRFHTRRLPPSMSVSENVTGLAEC